MKIIRGGAMMAALVVAMPASAEVDGAVRTALSLHAAGRPAEAYALLAPLESTRAGDPDYDYALGLAAVDSGQPGRAIVALQRVLAVQPGNSQARAEIARAYALAGDIDTARAEFATVINDPTIPDPVRQRFDGLVRRYDRALAGGGARATGFIEGEAGYDNNINAATSLTSITLPVFAFLGSATLGGNASRSGAAFGQVQAGLSGELGLDRQRRAYASILGVYRDSFKGSAFDQAALTGTVGVAHSAANRDVASLSAQVQQVWLAREGYRTSYSGIGQYTFSLREGRALSVAAQYSFLDYRTDPLRNANRYALMATYSDQNTFLSASGGREKTRALGGRHLSFTHAQATVGTESPLAEMLAVTATLNGEHRNYDGADPLFARGRVDTQIDGSLGLRYRLTPTLSVRPRLTYTRNFSNLALYDYERATASIALRAEF